LIEKIYFYIFIQKIFFFKNMNVTSKYVQVVKKLTQKYKALKIYKVFDFFFFLA